MRFMMIVKASETTPPPSPELMNAIGQLAEEMSAAGKMLEMGGLLQTSKGARIRLSGGKLSVTDGPFAEVKEVIGGFAIMRADSKEEAIEQGRRFMNIHGEIMGDDYEMELEIREMFDAPPTEHQQCAEESQAVAQQ